MTRKTDIGVYDRVFTPTFAVEFLVDFLKERDLFKYVFRQPIWEPTDESSNISGYLQERGYETLSTNIDTFDFLKDDPTEYYVNNHGKYHNILYAVGSIITNPPFSLKKEFIEKCYEYGKSFALLLPTEHIGTLFANELYGEHGINVLIPSRRIDFTGNGSPHTHTSWFYWSPRIELNKIFFRDLIV